MRCRRQCPTIGSMKTTLAHPVSLSYCRLARTCLAAATLSLAGLAVTDGAAHASTIAVTVTTDGGAGSLRDAITQANTNPGPDIINLPAGTYTLSIAGANEDANATGDLDIMGGTTIIGAGSGSTIIDAAGIDRVFDVEGGPTVLTNMTITNGALPAAGGSSGGNVRQRFGASLTIQDSIISDGSAAYGGAILGDTGALVITRTELVGNSVSGYPGNSGIAGAIFKGGGSLVLTDSLVTDNHADSNAVGIVYVTNGLGLSITNSTISNNTAESRIVVVEAQQAQNFAATFNHVTIANNTTVSLGGGGAGLSVNLISPAVLPVTVTGSLFVNNHTGATSSNCALSGNGGPVIASGGHNLSDDATCTGFTQPGDLNNNQLTTLGALANNGGPTRTLALVAGSSAIDAAGDCTVTTDQRGVARPQGAACDIGAYEVDVVVSPTTTEAATTVAPTTVAPTTVPPTTVAPGSTLVEPPTSSVGGGVVGATSTLPPAVNIELPHDGELPATGGSHGTSLWLATLVFSLGALMVLTARRLAR